MIRLRTQLNQPVLKKWLPGFWIATMTDVASVFARPFSRIGALGKSSVRLWVVLWMRISWPIFQVRHLYPFLRDSTNALP